MTEIPVPRLRALQLVAPSPAAPGDAMPPPVAVPSVGDSPSLKWLPFVLSIIAGSTDSIGFLGLGGLFTAHITGNLVVLAARLVAGEPARLSHLIAVPVFMVSLGLARLLAGGLERLRIPSLAPLLLSQLLLLGAFFDLAAAGPSLDPKAAMTVCAGMLGVAAMAVQNALVRISLKDAPSTAVMTTNITIFAMDLGEMLMARDALGVARARRRARHTSPAILGFLLGCALGASAEIAFGLNSLLVPIGFAAVACALAPTAPPSPARGPSSIPAERGG